jgi:type IV pilus biogenesis protein CpaD/CtpE
MIRISFAVCGMLVLLSACVSDSASDLSRAPQPVGLATVGRQLRLDAAAPASTQQQLRSLVAEVGQGDASSVHASVVVMSAAEAETWRRALIRLGVDPVRIATATDPRQRASIVLTRTAAIPADCAGTVNPALADDQLPSLDGLGRCIQDNNLSAMVVHQSDLVAPQPLARGDGARLAASVSDWRANRQGKLPTGSSNGSANADSSTSGSSSATSTGSTSTDSKSGASAAQ